MSLVTGAVAGGFALDLAVGELPNAFHPVRLFGRVVAMVDRDWRGPRITGAVLATGLPAAAAGTVGVVVGAGTAWSPIVGVALATFAVFATTSFRSLLATVRRVAWLADADLPAARRELRALAGRDAEALGPEAVRSAALESLAENLADGCVAPLSAFAVAAILARAGGLAPAPTLAFATAVATWVKAVNTMDSMWGYPDRPLGTAAARLDDTVMWVPARLTALLLAVALLAPRSLVRAHQWTDEVTSPNGGWPMGVLAAGLDVRLEKPGHYVLNPGGAVPTGDHVTLALRRAGLAGLSAYALTGVLAWF